MGAEVVPVESVTDYPSILGGRVKTLHPKVFGGILNRRDHEGDQAQMAEYNLPNLDLVIVDLYPFEATVASGASEADIVEKIDIGGIALIRGAAKNFNDVVVVPSMNDYGTLVDILKRDGVTSLEERKALAARGFRVSSHYDTMIHAHLSGSSLDKGSVDTLNLSVPESRTLRYGENPHQAGQYFGDLDGLLKPLHGKALSYNNLLDVDAAVQLMEEFKDDAPTFAILKHNNACGCATRETLAQAYADALAGDPTSAFGGVLIANRAIDLATANHIHELFCEVVIAPGIRRRRVRRVVPEEEPHPPRAPTWRLAQVDRAVCPEWVLGPSARQRHGSGRHLDVHHGNRPARERGGLVVCPQARQAHEVQHRGLRQERPALGQRHRPNQPRRRAEASCGEGQEFWV